MTPRREIVMPIGWATVVFASMVGDPKEIASLVCPLRMANIIARIKHVSSSFSIKAGFGMPAMLSYGREIGWIVRRHVRAHFNDCQDPETGQKMRIAAGYLPISRRTVNRSPMRGQIISMLLLFAVLIGSMVMPESSHAQDLLASHSSEVLNIEDQVDAATGQHGKQDSDVPCHAVAHHHCSIAIKVDVEVAGLAVWSPAATVAPQAVCPLSSLASAPPTEPPAA